MHGEWQLLMWAVCWQALTQGCWICAGTPAHGWRVSKQHFVPYRSAIAGALLLRLHDKRLHARWQLLRGVVWMAGIEPGVLDLCWHPSACLAAVANARLA